MKSQLFNFEKLLSDSLLLNACSPDLNTESGNQTNSTDAIANKTFDFITY